MDLYDRLEELQGMARLLIDDTNRIKPLVGERNPDPSDQEKTHRRCYVRSVFALIEAFAEQHRRLLVELARGNVITIPEDKLRTLRQIRLVTKDGTMQERENLLKLFEKIKIVYHTAANAFNGNLNVTFGDKGWTTFQDAMELRNRVTHPKRHEDLWIFEGDLQTVNAANEWFKTLQNEFVRLARAHRQQHRW